MIVALALIVRMVLPVSVLVLGMCGVAFMFHPVNDPSKPERAQRGVIVRAATERPTILPLSFIDWQVVDAGNTQPH